MTWLFTAIAMGTGMGHGEILRINWADIDFANRRSYLAKGKAGQRVQPLPPSLAAMLANEHENIGKAVGWLVPTTRKDAKHAHREQMSEKFRRAAVRAKLDPTKVTLHVLRHTAITGLI